MRLLLVLLAILSLPATAAPVRVCVVGDSISAGFTPSTWGWNVPLASLNAGADWGAKNIAHSGDTAAQALALYGSDAKWRGCTHVAILIGTNNLASGDSAESIYATIDAIADAAEADGSQVILLAILPRGTGASWSAGLGTRLLALNALMAARPLSIYVDTYTALLEPASSPPALATAAGGATDGLHPNNVGQAMIATAVQAAVVAAGGW